MELLGSSQHISLSKALCEEIENSLRHGSLSFLQRLALNAPHYSQKTIPFIDNRVCVLWIMTFLTWITCQEGIRATLKESS